MLNNEQIGISAEVAIADVYGVRVSDLYRARSDDEIVEAIKPTVEDIFLSYNLPKPVRHTAEHQSAVDFELEQGKTLSVKTNKSALGKSAPQRIGQASSNTWFNLLAEELQVAYIPESREEKARLFETIVLTRFDKLLEIYWRNMFSCDFLLCIYNVVGDDDNPTNDVKYIVFDRQDSPIWEANKISFTRPTVDDWNESNTIKYNNVSIGEFQVHHNRDNFKFRFNLSGIVKLMGEHKLGFS